MTDNLDETGIEHLLWQAANGEFAVLQAIARTMTAAEFAAQFAAPMRLWGKPHTYWCVEIEGIEYLWRLDTGEYDGWNAGVGRGAL